MAFRAVYVRVPVSENRAEGPWKSELHVLKRGKINGVFALFQDAALTCVAESSLRAVNRDMQVQMELGWF